MIYEVVERIAQHLQDPTLGVNGFVKLVPTGAGTPAMESVAVTSEFDITYLPGGMIPVEYYANGPLVLVRRGDDVGEFAPAGNPEIMDADSRVGVAVLVLYPRQEVNALHLENRRLSALLRCVQASVAHFFESVHYDDRCLRDVQIVTLLGAPRLVPTISRISEIDVMAGALLLDLNVTDRWAENVVPPIP